MQLPPMCSARSMTATRLPKYAAWAPPFSPAGPQPITMRSNVSLEATRTSEVGCRQHSGKEQPESEGILREEVCPGADSSDGCDESERSQNSHETKLVPGVGVEPT